MDCLVVESSGSRRVSPDAAAAVLPREDEGAALWPEGAADGCEAVAGGDEAAAGEDDGCGLAS